MHSFVSCLLHVVFSTKERLSPRWGLKKHFCEVQPTHG